MRTADRSAVLGPLLDAVLVGARPAWGTMTGWERSQDAISTRGRAFQESWFLIPVAEDLDWRESRALGMSGPGQERKSVAGSFQASRPSARPAVPESSQDKRKTVKAPSRTFQRLP